MVQAHNILCVCIPGPRPNVERLMLNMTVYIVTSCCVISVVYACMHDARETTNHTAGLLTRVWPSWSASGEVGKSIWWHLF